ncbi:MAG: hypothetical protein IH624_17365 [Phycisphaerae bacterium]|nr:hypothetical protein [Phycisphaerae bacterium]
MAAFSNDKDLLRCEAAVFGDLHFPWQVRCAGEGGVLSGATFAAAGVDFDAAGVQAGGVLYVRSADGSVDAVYEIVSADAPGQLTVSVLRGDDADPPVAPPAHDALHWRISTFDPQAQQVALELTAYFGLRPGRPDSAWGADDVVDTTPLRQASVYGVLANVYATCADGDRDAHGLWTKSRHYRQLYERARRRCRISIDAGGDGVIEKRIAGGSAALVRD